MTITRDTYLTIADAMATAVSDESLDFIAAVVDTEVEISVSALTLYIGDSLSLDEPRGSLWFDLAKLDEQEGNVVHRFIDNEIPNVGSEEPKDQELRDAARDDGQTFEYYWVPDSKGKMKLRSVFADYAERTHRGKEYMQRLDVIKGCLEDTAGDGMAYLSEYKSLGKPSLRAHKSVLTAKLNKIENLTRNAIGIHQVHTKMKALTDHNGDPMYGLPRGIRVDFVKGNHTKELGKTKKPFCISDTTVQPLEQREYSVSSFVSFDVDKAQDKITRGTAPLEALRETLKRTAPPIDGDVTVNATMPVDDAEKALIHLYTWLSNPDRTRALVTRMNDARKGVTLRKCLINMYFEELQDIVGPLEQEWVKGKNKEADEMEEQGAPKAPRETNAQMLARLANESKARLKAIK